ncbi:MAG: phenylalanine--tRNA ligase subunit alpha [Candidatus Cloacimonetes bacterium]|nr:phenylalanine--tRNA ligase subunit alpha [Candidatus Cloacimonadota bacterium]
MKDKLDKLIAAASEAVASAKDQIQLQQVKSCYLGKKSELNRLMKQLGTLPREERPEFGKKINLAKQEVEKLLKAKDEELKSSAYQTALVKDKIDVTMPGRKLGKGSLHPITLAERIIEDVLIGLGFEVAEGFDVEDEFHNFDALNTPEDHPARELTDTFYLGKDVLLRTHTSTAQIRVMETHKPPIRIISFGKTYRNDNDASHSPAFHQIEMLVIDEGINFADMKDMLNLFVSRLFGEKIGTRIRPHFFPFTEPSAEMDVQCVKCDGAGCNVCKNSGWLELGGAGMVDPYVLEAVGIDSEKYTGYAFGMGVDRIAMQMFNIPDMRMLFENDIRMLRQFG